MYKDRTGKFRQRSRAFQKRTWLANLLTLGAGVTVSVAGSVAHSYDGVTLPTKVDGRLPMVRSNPFVSSAPKLGGEIQQTSDMQLSELHLKSIGTAVGLVPIGNPRPSKTVLEVSQPEQSKVRINPLATTQSSDFDHPIIGLVDEAVTPLPAIETPELASEKSQAIVQQSQARIIGLKQVESSNPDGPSIAAVETGIVIAEKALPLADTRAPDRAEAVVAQVNEASAAKPDESESGGVSFSLTDDAGDESEIHLDPLDTDRQLAADAPDTVSTEEPVGLLIPPPVAVSTRQESFVPEKVANHPLEVQRQEVVANRLPLLPTPNPAWTEHSMKESRRSSDDSRVIRYPDRRRAHVEVVAPPMISAQPDQEQGQDDGTKVVSTRIIPAKLAGFQVKSAEPTNPPPEAKVAVTEKPKPDDPITALTKKLRTTYSTSRIQISEVKGKILVRGECATQEDAIEIIRLVRNEFLVPVDDQLVIR